MNYTLVAKTRPIGANGTYNAVSVAAGAATIGPPGSGAANGEGTRFLLAAQAGATTITLADATSPIEIEITQAPSANVTTIQDALATTIITLTPPGGTAYASCKLMTNYLGNWVISFPGPGCS